VLPFGEELPDEELQKAEGELVPVLKYLLFLGVCALPGAVSGWLTYRQAACVWDAATVGVWVMCVFALWRGLSALHIPW